MKGELIIEGKFRYDVEMVNGFMKLTGKDGVFYLRGDGKPEIVSRIKREIAELKLEIVQKEAIIKLCKIL